MSYALFGIGIILLILFIIQFIKGKRYGKLFENLDEHIFPLKSIYTVGYAWSTLKLFRINDRLASSLRIQASLLYEPKYSEYYANVVWAQILSFVHFFLMLTFLLAGIMFDIAAFFVIVGLVAAAVCAVYFFRKMKSTLAKRTAECEAVLPEVVSTMAILVNSGMILKDAWNMIADGGKGAFYDLMRKASENIRNGYSDSDAIFLFAKTTNSQEIKKFTSALIQSMERGGGELSVFLAQQSSELWNKKRQRMLQGGEKAATKLLVPILIIFVGVIIIVITAAFAGLSF